MTNIKQNQQNFRIETDSFGEIQVPIDAYYAAQTQRSVQNFPICSGNSGHKMPKEVILAMLHIKKTAAITNQKLMIEDPQSLEFKKFSSDIAEKIIDAVDTIIEKFDWFYLNHFPLVIWQTGSGTQTNMNVNEVIASVANEKTTGAKGGKSPIHPNDHCNLGQSSNDTFPTAMNIAVVVATYQNLLPSLIRFAKELNQKAVKFANVVKIGRTHTQDATPVTLGQEFSAYQYQIECNIGAIKSAITNVLLLAQGGTAVGTGLNCHPKFATTFADEVTKVVNLQAKECCKNLNLDLHFKTNPNKFSALSNNDELVNFHGVLNTIATSLMKIANDIRFLASGPRSGLGEISLPENEPGSSIMPGKVNPTQCEALTMLACQVIGNNVAVTSGGMQGHFELNVFRPMIIRNVIESINLISDGITSFVDNCLIGIIANEDRIKQLLDQSLMLVTALNPYIGYDNAAKIAKYAHKNNLTLKQAALDLNLVSAVDFDNWVKAEDMV